jgi:phytoene dehydrogenase-like protein
MRKTADAVVIGGGLGGLAAATYLARAGRAVILFEKAGVGGRATTHTKKGFCFNLGAHALYRGGPAMQVLAELGVSFQGRTPSTSRGFAIRAGKTHTLPAGFVSLVTTRLFDLPAKLEVGRLMSRMQSWDPAALGGISLRAWVEKTSADDRVRELLYALARLTSYVHDPDRYSASAALRQIQLGLLRGVLYLDGGWQTLVDRLTTAATAAGVRIESHAPVQAVDVDHAVRGVRLANGTSVEAPSVVLATGLPAAAALVGKDSLLGAWARAAIPVKVACLDVALSRLPRPSLHFALGMDQPWYLSVHSQTAKLAPEGGALVHTVRYLGNDSPDTARAELEALLDLVQPGWRDVVVEQRFLPAMVAQGAMVMTETGIKGRPGPQVPGTGGLFVVGDWVGAEGMLADASLASARRAAELVLKGLRPSTSRAA